MATIASSGASPSQSPEAPDEEHETAEHRRDRHELIQLLALAHRRLDDRGVPRINHT